MLTEIYILFIVDLMIPHNGMNSINVIRLECLLGLCCDPKDITGLFRLFYAVVCEEFNGDVLMVTSK